MIRTIPITFLVNADEQRMANAIAEYLQRSRSDALRLLIRQAAREIPTDAPAPTARATDAERRGASEVMNVAAN